MYCDGCTLKKEAFEKSRDSGYNVYFSDKRDGFIEARHW